MKTTKKRTKVPGIIIAFTAIVSIDAFTTPTRRSTWLTMKKPNPAPPISIPSSQEEMPANLKRKIQAKRPMLGHIVPKSVKNDMKKNRGARTAPKLRPQGQSRDTGRYNNPSNLKILGGELRGRRLVSPDVFLRPMMGKVREAVFSSFASLGLYEPCKNTRHLDIFSGSGSVGLESLSRGASHCTFVDLSFDCCDAIAQNLELCEGLEGRTSLVCCGDAFASLLSPQDVGMAVDTPPFDIITLCPPYEEVVYADLLQAVIDSDLVKEDTIVLVEYPVELGCLPHVIQRKKPKKKDDNSSDKNVISDGGGTTMIGIRNRKYGRTVIAIYIVDPTGRIELAQSRPEEFVSLR